jgi:hypothetical protein
MGGVGRHCDIALHCRLRLEKSVAAFSNIVNSVIGSYLVSSDAFFIGVA